MNNIDNYLSDDEEIDYDDQDKEKLFDELYPPYENDEDCEMDEEFIKMRQIIYNSKKEIDYSKNEIPEIKLHNISNCHQTAKKMTLSSLNNYLQKKEDELKPKRFVSTRCIDRKVKAPEEKRRSFNPRLVPYFKSDVYKNFIKKKNYNLDNDFPNL
jgi:hypothetical protein